MGDAFQCRKVHLVRPQILETENQAPVEVRPPYQTEKTPLGFQDRLTAGDSKGRLLLPELKQLSETLKYQGSETFFGL